ncbi:MAG TPA: hypothetical protein VFJ98_08380, partial [Mycobacteriales bacterium]|nr:hypothetical protein [Mycobacteriales bacterium]
TWSTTIDLTDLGQLPISATAVQVDGVGNSSAASAAGNAVKDTGVPAQPAGLAFDGVVSSLDPTVQLSGTGESGATVSISVDDTVGATPAVPATTTVTAGNWSKSINLSSLADGTLTATVTQSDAVGNVSAVATKTVLKDTVADVPTQVAFDGPANDDDPTVKLSGHAEPGSTVKWRVMDETGAQVLQDDPRRIEVGEDGLWSTANLNVSGLADGVLTGRALLVVDAYGNGPGDPVDVTTRKDTKKPPTPTLTRPSAAFTLGPTRVAWDGSGASFDVGYTQAHSGERFRSAVYPSTWQGVTTHSVTRDQPLGTTDCFFVRARDAAGNKSFWTPNRCTTRPFDDRGLKADDRWVKRTGSSYWQHTVRRTTKRGATLTLASTTVKRIAVVATRCDGCGRIAVSVGGVRVGTFDLDAARTRYHRLFKLTLPSTMSGRVAVTVLTKRHRVEIDGLGVSRI